MLNSTTGPSRADFCKNAEPSVLLGYFQYSGWLFWVLYGFVLSVLFDCVSGGVFSAVVEWLANPLHARPSSLPTVKGQGKELFSGFIRYLRITLKINTSMII